MHCNGSGVKHWGVKAQLCQLLRRSCLGMKICNHTPEERDNEHVHQHVYCNLFARPAAALCRCCVRIPLKDCSRPVADQAFSSKHRHDPRRPRGRPSKLKKLKTRTASPDSLPASPRDHMRRKAGSGDRAGSRRRRAGRWGDCQWPRQFRRGWSHGWPLVNSTRKPICTKPFREQDHCIYERLLCYAISPCQDNLACVPASEQVARLRANAVQKLH